MVAPGAPGHAPAPADPLRTPAIVLLVAAVLITVGTISKSWITASEHGGTLHAGLSGWEACMESQCVSIPSEALGKIPGDVTAFQMVGLIGGIASILAAAGLGGALLAKKQLNPSVTKAGNVAFSAAAFGMSYFTFRLLAEGHGASIGWAGIPGLGGVILAGVMARKAGKLLAAGGVGMPQAYALPQQPYGAPQPYPPQGAQPYPQQPQQPYAQQSQPQQPYMPQPAQQSQPQQPYMPQPAQQSQPQQPYAPQPAQAAAPQAHACPRCGGPLEFVTQYQRWFCRRDQQYV